MGNDSGEPSPVKVVLATASGYVATGAITGETGWLPTDSPAMSGTPNLDRGTGPYELATVDDLSAARKSVLEGIDKKIDKAILNATYTPYGTSISDSQCMTMGYLNFSDIVYDGHPTRPSTLPTQSIWTNGLLPKFIDGTTPDISKCKWLISPIRQTLDDFTGGGHTYQTSTFYDTNWNPVDIINNTTPFYYGNISQYTVGGGILNANWATGGQVAYIIIGTR